MLGRSREDSESQAERETTALLRSAHQAEASRGALHKACCLLESYKREILRKPILCAEQGHNASGEVQQLRAGETQEFSHQRCLCDALVTPLNSTAAASL